VVVIFIGKEFKYRKFIQNNIFSSYTIDNAYFFDNVDFELEHIIKKHSKILFVANEKLYSTVSKVIATLNNDTLELKDGYLIPTKTILYEKNSFLIQHENRLINVVKVTDYIPHILFNQDTYTLHIFNYDVSSVEIFIKPIFESFKIDYVVYENEGGWCEVKFEKFSDTLFNQLKGFIPNLLLSNNIFEYIKEELEKRQEKITFAESCTGGLLASYMTKISGSSEIFDGSVITYSNKIKSEWLGVDERALGKFGAVSEETVQQMLLGVLEISNSDYAIAVSGIAGPSGGSEAKPVGTVYIGVGNKEGKFAIEMLHLNGNREEIQYQTMMHSIRLFIKFFKFL